MFNFTIYIPFLQYWWVLDTELTSYCFEGAGDSEAWDPMFVESIGSNSESESLRDSPNCFPGTRPPGTRPGPSAAARAPARSARVSTRVSARSGNESARSSSSSFRCLKVRHFYVCASSASNEAQVRHQKEGSHTPSHQATKPATKPPSHQATIQKCFRMF